MKALALTAALCLTPLPALAHKVIAGVFPSGHMIEGEIGFSNGTMAVGQPVTVTDPSGKPLGETVTDADGFFTFTPVEPVTHIFRADMGAGHIANVEMVAEDVARILGKAPVETPVVAVTTTDQSESPSIVVAALTEREREVIAEAVRDEIRPLRREIAAYREKNDLQTILGGLGYISGLFGLGFYIAARRKLTEGKDT